MRQIYASYTDLRNLPTVTTTSMKTSRSWLQKYFDAELPAAEVIADALTFHAVEIEEVAGDLIDANILPDRAAYMLSHRGVATEVAAVLDTAIASDPFRTEMPVFPETSALTVSIEDETQCYRYMGAVVRGVEVGPSPKWLKDALESVGQRSINNVVDATNYVMLDLGQPLHAFDAAKLVEKDGQYAIRVRGSYEEKIATLTGEAYDLPNGTLLITDANADKPIGIAGVKGGMAASITTDTRDIIIESASFNATLVRKTSQRLKLWTDASQRYQNKVSPELTAYAMRDVLKLITNIAGGTSDGVVDVYPESVRAENMPMPVSVSLSKINSLLGSLFQLVDVEHAFDRLGFNYTVLNDVFTVTPPFERRDLNIPEDLIEEVGRILGYEHIDARSLPALTGASDQNRFRGIERIKDLLIEHGYSEISSQTFAENGHVMLANPLDTTKPALRPTLMLNMRAALQRAKQVAPRVLGVAKVIKLFEIGTVFTVTGEHLALVLGYEQLEGKKSPTILQETIDALKEWDVVALAAEGEDHLFDHPDVVEVQLQNLEKIGEGYEPKKILLGAYHPFSIYPAAIRDVAVWTPERTEESDVADVIIKEAGDLLARIDLFDRFTKTTDGVEKVSYAFRLVFESFERTLSDEDLNPIIEEISEALHAQEGWQVR